VCGPWGSGCRGEGAFVVLSDTNFAHVYVVNAAQNFILTMYSIQLLNGTRHHF
jgi:hypothetical protein